MYVISVNMYVLYLCNHLSGNLSFCLSLSLRICQFVAIFALAAAVRSLIRSFVRSLYAFSLSSGVVVSGLFSLAVHCGQTPQRRRLCSMPTI